MNITILVPRVVQGYVAQLPEVTNNAYSYFNYDNRVVEERVDRGDFRMPYKGAGDFTDVDYDSLVTYAGTLVNPVLEKYSPRTAHEDALHTAIRSFCGGLFDGKVNANCFGVLIKGMESKRIAAKKDKEVSRRELGQYGLKVKDIPRETVKVRRNVPHFVKTDKGKIKVKKS